MVNAFSTLLMASLALLLLHGCATTTARIPVEERSMVSNNSLPPAHGGQEIGESRRGTVATAALKREPVERSLVERVQEEGVDQADPLQELLRQIEQALQQHEVERAEMLVERALRIDSQRPGLWHDLAQIRLRQSSWREVVVLARRSNGLAAGKQGLQEQNWSLIAQAKEALGDHSGARAAWKRAGE